MPLYSTACPLPINRKIFRHRVSFSPTDLTGLSLWLKGDAGVTTSTVTPTYISQIVISGAGESTSNGTYVRSSGGNTTFYSGSNAIQGGGANWLLYDDSFGDATYENTNSLEQNSWTEYNATGAPSAVNTTSSGTPYTGVTSWADQSGNGRNATPHNPTNKPLFNASDKNEKPTISLTSMSDAIERVFTISSNPLGASGSTAFSVQYVEDVCGVGDDNGALLGNFGASEIQTHYPYGPDCLVYDAFATTSRKEALTPPTTISDAWSIYSVHITNGEWKNYVNGQLMHSDTGNTYDNSIGGDDTTLYIGKQTGLGYFSLKGKVAEVIVYNRVLTTPELQQVEAYLNAKYAIY